MLKAYYWIKILVFLWLRIVAKSKANNQWGYLAMNTNKIQHKTIGDINSWLKMLDDRNIIHNVEVYDINCPCLQILFLITMNFTQVKIISGICYNLWYNIFI